MPRFHFDFRENLTFNPEENKSAQDDWYKNALARAKLIAQNMAVPPPVPEQGIKPEPKIEPQGKINAIPFKGKSF